MDISRRAATDPDTLLGLDDLERHESEHGTIPAGAAVLLRSGWDVRPPVPEAYLGFDGVGYHAPGFSGEAVDWLVEHRGVYSLGTDTASLDAADATGPAAHLALLGAGRYGIEGLVNLHRLPAAGTTLIVGVVPWEDGTGGHAGPWRSWGCQWGNDRPGGDGSHRCPTP